MALVAAKCTNCGANLQVDSDKDAAVCPYCGTPFIVEKAINNYHITNNIKADVVNVYGTTSNEYDQRAEALNRMSRMISHFGEKQAEYDELERVTGEIVRRSQGVKKTPLVFGILLTVVGFVCMLIGQNRSQIPTFAIVLLIPGLLLIGLYVLLAILNRNRLEALSVRRDFGVGGNILRRLRGDGGFLQAHQYIRDGLGHAEHGEHGT